MTNSSNLQATPLSEMTKFNIGDAIGDCPACDGQKSIIYKGSEEAMCKACASSFNITLEENEEVVDTPPPAPPPPPPPPLSQPKYSPPKLNTPKPIQKSSEPVKQINTPIKQIGAPKPRASKVIEPKAEDVGKLSPLTPLGQQKSLQLSSNLSPAVTQAKELGLPDYVMKSRPWRWAHELDNVGNPYRSDTKNWQVFDAISKSPEMTIAEIVSAVQNTIGEKLSFILTVYEVVSQCIAAGLLIMDSETRKISVCTGQPKPAQFN